MRARFFLSVLIGAPLVAGLVAGCSKGGSFSSSSDSTTGSSGESACYGATSGGSFVSATGTYSNSMAVDIDSGGICAGTFNNPCTSVTICTPGNTSQCQVINDILVDTGSYGLRIFSQALSQNLCGSLQQSVDSGGDPMGECAQFGSLDTWGPVMTASVQLAGETPVEMPIQVINSSYSYAPSTCSSAVTGPGVSGAAFNGILGVGLFKYDCSDSGDCPADAETYFGCRGTRCSATSLAMTSQVANPVALLGEDNNGILFDFSSFGGTGSNSYTGAVYLGIGTEADNTPSGTTVYQAGNVEYASFPTFLTQTEYGGSTSYSYGVVDSGDVSESTFSFLDSGTNVYLFPSADSGIPTCGGSLPGYFCPGSTVNDSATVQGESCSGTDGLTCTTNGSTGTNDFEIENTLTLSEVNPFNYAMTDIGADSAGGTALSNPLFVWGLPFFYGKKIYVGIDGTTATINSATQTGPYWAY